MSGAPALVALALQAVLVVAPAAAAPPQAAAAPQPGARSPRLELAAADRVPPLTPPQLMRLRRASQLRAAGLLDSARVVLQSLLGETPHHPLVLAGLAEVQVQRQAWGELERLATRERGATRDSTLLGEALALALERQGRAAAAAQVAVEAWVASPEEAGWARGTLARLLPADARSVREPLRRAVLQRPKRSDLANALARLDWAAGDPRAALRALADADHAGADPPARWSFAGDLLRSASAHDSTGAEDALLDLAADRATAPPYRFAAARHVWEVTVARGRERDDAPRVARALADLPGDRWDPAFLVAVARALREGGHTGEARALLAPVGSTAPATLVSLERALADLRDGPPERALPALLAAAPLSEEGAWRYAEALFFAGHSDSARVWYQRVSEHADGPWAGAAFERLFLIEDADPPAALADCGRLAYEEWRGEPRRATAIADSLIRTLPRGALWAQVALRLAALRDAAGDPHGALGPLLVVADSLAGDRLAPLARQRLGDLYLDRIHDEAQALAQYEECLARYPKAWNAPEVRRQVEKLRRERRF